MGEYDNTGNNCRVLEKSALKLAYDLAAWFDNSTAGSGRLPKFARLNSEGPVSVQNLPVE